jgi:hypothetical protein
MLSRCGGSSREASSQCASTHKSATMRTVVDKIVLICSAAKVAYAHPDLQKDASATPCAFAELLNGEGGLDGVASSSKENTEQHEAEQPSPSSSSSVILKGSSKNNSDSTVKLRRRAQAKKRASTVANGRKKKQQSSTTTNIFLPNAIDNSGGRNQNQNGGGGGRGKKKAQNRPNQEVASEGRNISPGGCFTTTMYDDIDADILKIQNSITDLRDRGGFLGGILRMAAHDAMDFDPSLSNPMGPDGCYDPNHPNNAGLETVWSDQSALRKLHMEKYPHISRADFWIACANAVIRQTSIGQDLDMKNKFRWGRKDSDSCSGQADRLPVTTSCSQHEEVFINRMGMTWVDIVALMGAHTLGHCDRVHSGHQGTWVHSNSEATIFDKKYYEQIFMNNWRVEGQGTTQDWTTGLVPDNRVMLNTDICLAYNIDSNMPCCTKGNSQCRQCPRYSDNSPRKAAEEAVLTMLGGSPGNTDNSPFYSAFEVAWNKLTTLGQENLLPLSTECLI